MNNQLVLENYLLILKSTVEVYVHGTLESSNEKVRSILKDSLQETLLHQANTYDLMAENGFYKVNNVNKSSIKKIYEKVSQN